ncbi:hypothetical protein F0562_017293 [Nyssa sinensis]|uniref:5-methyltetrahydropteroyltriglutamate--homocysteine S-methyltransferase n=1 Tax=Nyssa sinensis TaxID=561372 RepID=A0A5J4ZFV4_9ASTE|nr:hypothetical protein F0562_017293 [Nyssa sinensis]
MTSFQLHSVVVPGAAVKDSSSGFDSVANDWFTTKKKQVFTDSGIKIMFVGSPVLAQLVANGFMEEIREVLEKSDPSWKAADSVDSDGHTLLHLAIAQSRPDLVQLLLEFDPDVEALSRSGSSPLEAAAASWGSSDCGALAGSSSKHRAIKILHLGPNSSGLPEAAIWSLCVAARKGEVRTIHRLIENGAALNGCDQHGWTALHRASFKGRIDAVRTLIKRGIDVDARDEDGYTALHCAVESGHADVIELLVKQGADVEARTNKGVTALQIAESLHYLGMTRILIHGGATKDGSVVAVPAQLPFGGMIGRENEIGVIKKKPNYRTRALKEPVSDLSISGSTSSRTMASHIVGYPRMGPKRELKFALESFWDGKSTAEDLQKVAADLRSSIWKQMAGAGIKYIPSNTFSYYDQVLDTTAMLGAVPPRYGWNGGEIGFDTFFSMARGNASVPAMEMTKWFDTNYHFIVPELGPDVKFSYASHKAVNEYKEAKALGVDTVPVLVGPVSYLLLSKPAKGVEKSFSLLSLLDKILPIYEEVVAELKAAGASWIQFDEPTLVKDLEAHQLHAFTSAYSQLESTLSGLNVVIETYFADIPAEAYKTLTSLKGVTGFGFDFVRGSKTLDLIKGGFPSGKYLFAGVVDGRNIWANDLAASLSILQSLEGIVGKDKLVVSTSCSLLHTAVDLINETKLDKELKSWLAFAAQKVVEVNALAKALAGHKDEEFFSANAAAQASRKSSPRVTNEAVQKAAAALKGSDHRRATNVSTRLDAQQKKLNLPILPTTTIGSFPQTMELRRVRREYKAKKISEEEYITAIKGEINKVVKLQEELDIDVLVHGEPERNDMVEYFGEQLSGFAFTVNGWVQSYGSRCVKPPIIYGDVSRPKPMTVFWSSMAQSMTARPMKGMLTGPVTILNWSFVRNDQPRFKTCYQIALAIKDEVEDLEKAGINVIQIDEAALREGLPLRKSEEAFYLEWAVHSFRITNCGVQDTTQIHTHMCYSNFNDIIHSIIDMDADVITIENSRSDEKLLSVFREGVKYGAGIGPGVYDIHSPRIPSTEEIADRINKMLAVLETNILWVNPDCGLKTRKYTEVKPALQNMVAAAKLLRTQLASAK